MSAPNAELAYKVLDHIDAHPEQWDQGVYIGKAECGTVACFAGWACLLSGDEPDFTSPYSRKPNPATDVLADGQLVSNRAEELLGAERFIDEGSDFEADLFSQHNSREDLGRYVAAIFGPRPAVTS